MHIREDPIVRQDFPATYNHQSHHYKRMQQLVHESLVARTECVHVQDIKTDM